MLDLRQKLVLFIGLFAGVVLAVVLGILFLSKNEPKQEQTNQENIENQEQQVDVQTSRTIATQTEQVFIQNSEEVSAKQTATIFVERYETRSNQNDNMHIEDVLPLVTDSMSSWLLNQKIEQNQVYIGQTTNVLASSVSNLTSLSATVNFDARQTIQNQDGETTNIKSGRVDLLKVGNIWKVDGFYWD